MLAKVVADNWGVIFFFFFFGPFVLLEGTLNSLAVETERSQWKGDSQQFCVRVVRLLSACFVRQLDQPGSIVFV